MRFGLDDTNGVWIGLNDTDKQLVWTWSDNSNYNWSRWAVGIEPSLILSENCVTSMGAQSENYAWRRQSCNATAGFVCQNRLNKTNSSKVFDLY